MSNLTPLSTSMDTDDEHRKASRRRNKPQMSCTSCRQRKLKCNRHQPCENCTKRGLVSACTYVHNLPQPVRRPANTINVQERIHHLEELVTALMNNVNTNEFGVADGRKSGIPIDEAISNGQTDNHRIRTENPDNENNDPDHNQVMDSFGTLSISHQNSETSYVGSMHWAAILDDIAEVKGYFSREDGFYRPTFVNTELGSETPEILLGGRNYITKAEILDSIPPQPVVNGLISQYFNSMDMASLITHTPTFQKEYVRFWENPSAASVMWIGLLYSMMSLAVFFHLHSGDEHAQSPSTSEEAFKLYREKTVQCLILGNYTKPVTYTIETLLLYSTCEIYRSRDTQFGISMLCGVIVRLAMRMGYHRDAAHFPNISVFHGEMRRRIWIGIVQLELLTSSQVGLPTIIKSWETDTKIPHNLLDDDFDETTEILPPSRPMTESTVIGYAIEKIKLLKVYAMIVDQVNSMQPVSYNEVMRLDSLLHDTYRSLPPHLQMRPMESSIIDAPVMILRRVILDLIFQKARCFLHRKYLIPGQSNQQYHYSRRSCVDAAMKTLRHKSICTQATQPGGKLCQVAWCMSSSTVNFGFFLAAMIVCLDLDQGIRNGTISDESDNPAESGNVPDTWKREDMLQALEEAFQIWTAASRFSTDASKAALAMEIMLRKVKMTSPACESPSNNIYTSTSTSDIGQLHPEIPDAMPMQTDRILTTQPMDQTVSMGESQNWSNQPNTVNIFPTSNLDMIQSMIDSPTNLDWASWDRRFLQTQYTDALREPGHPDFAFPFQEPIDNSTEGLHGFEDPR
ncbi:MAG: hypothetical protein M1834_004306 [Cirrosporium novae-zelandiae]|nr:MAG: hypothetical protein M1834_004306 [Cirrosporium novae-zelandiae]